VLQNYYAYSKFLGDIFASRIDSTILRTNFFGNNPKFKEKGFTGWIMKSLVSQKKINGFDDIYFNPLSLDTLADLINQVIKVKPFGIFNLGSLEGMSKLEFILIFATKLGYSKDLINAIPFNKGDEAQANRPMSMIMNCKKIQNKLNINLPTLSEEIDKVIKSYI
jgi:dTDP-4-dehydrorhamnose reductase